MSLSLVTYFSSLFYLTLFQVCFVRFFPVWFPCSVSALFYSLILCLDLGSVFVGVDFFNFQVDTSPPPFGKGSMALIAIVHSLWVTVCACALWPSHATFHLVYNDQVFQSFVWLRFCLWSTNSRLTDRNAKVIQIVTETNSQGQKNSNLEADYLERVRGLGEWPSILWWQRMSPSLSSLFGDWWRIAS